MLLGWIDVIIALSVVVMGTVVVVLTMAWWRRDVDTLGW